MNQQLPAWSEGWNNISTNQREIEDAVVKIEKNFQYVQEHELYTWDIKQCLDNFMSLTSENRKRAICYLFKRENDKKNIIQIIEDVDYEDLIRIPTEKEIDEFDEKFKQLEHKNKIENKNIVDFHLFYIDIFLDKFEDDYEIGVLDTILSSIMSKSQIYFMISTMYEDVENAIKRKDSIPMYRIRISLEYNTRNAVLYINKIMDRDNEIHTENFFTYTSNNTTLEELIDITINVRWWESIDDILSNPNKHIDVIDVGDCLDRRNSLDYDGDEDEYDDENE